jgi:N-acetylglucosaminyldiphosphoundecaprenol N-acetyl-beta-D-mannosaminyltransferase
MGRHLLAPTGARDAARTGKDGSAGSRAGGWGGAATLLCAGVPIAAVGPAEAARLLLELPVDTGHDVHLCNAYTIALADRDHDLHALLCAAALNFADGMSVVWANRWRYRGLAPDRRVYGPDLFRAVLRHTRTGTTGHYLLGSTPAVLAALRDRIALEYPGARIAGAESPPFRPLTGDERAAQHARIAASGARFVWVGLGTPKQDWAAARLAAELPVVAVAVGAAFDFVAGTKRQAPPWMQQAGLEWAHRLASEPRRLWKRYLFGNARFGYAVARDRRGEPAGRGW